MIRYHSHRTGFTLIEVIFAIVILGIVASIGAEMITQTYMSYIVQRAQYRANIKTELAINQIANRLRYAIPGTVYARKVLASTGNDVVSIQNVSASYWKVLQWVGYDGDSFEAIFSNTNRKPGWSGFCDINASSSSTIKTPGSNLNLASTIITNLGGTGSVGNAELYFAGDGNRSYGISSISGESISMDTPFPSGTKISERYKLAWSSYAVEVDPNGDLQLHHHFAPVAGTAINNDTTTLLLKNVTNFRFQGINGVMRIKICKKERIGMDSNDTVHACKEKVIF